MAVYDSRRRALHSAYSLWPQSGDGCSYCGIYADTYDHVPPLSKVQALGKESFEKAHIRLWLVPACRECNSILSGHDADTITERKAAIKTKLKKRYARYLNKARWSSEELDELGHNLRTMIETGVNIEEWVKRRIQW